MFNRDSGSIGRASLCPDGAALRWSTIDGDGADDTGRSRLLTVANRWLVRAASVSWAMRCCSGSTELCALTIGRPRSPGKGGPSWGAPDPDGEVLRGMPA